MSEIQTSFMQSGYTNRLQKKRRLDHKSHRYFRLTVIVMDNTFGYSCNERISENWEFTTSCTEIWSLNADSGDM